MASLAFRFAYDNNFSGIRTGLDWAGEQLETVGEAITNSTLNPMNWGWG